MAITDHIVVSAGPVFAVSARSGDITPNTAEGFYAQDTRFLSSLRLLVDGQEPETIGSGQINHIAASFYADHRMEHEPANNTLSVVRDRYVGNGLHEDISLLNHSTWPRKVRLEISFDADFADIFEVRRGTVEKTGRVTVEEREGQHLCLAYNQGQFHRETWVSFSSKPQSDGRTATFELTLEPRQAWMTCLSVHPIVDGPPKSMPCFSEVLGSPFDLRPPAGPALMKTLSGDRREWRIEHLPYLESKDSGLLQTYHQAIADLRSLEMEMLPGRHILAAGLPWFMAIFGRDSIISAIQTKLLGPDLMVGTLHTLASLQATTYDLFREAEPGKIPHEVRQGELSILERVPHSRYYGSVDATLLFLILLWEAYEWTGDKELLLQLLPAAESALWWTNRYGDRDGDGFVEHRSMRRRRSSHGLLNQGWKDSDDSVSMAEGPIPDGPIALAEVQGYVYDAKLRMAKVYDVLGFPYRARRLERSAERLKAQFNDAYWMQEEGFYAIALDGHGKQVTSVSSNPGHCLWSGIIDEKRAGQVVERLMAPDMFSGWGIRTLSTEMARYDPVSYHNGSIWPHDNSLIARGMARYGFMKEARDVAHALLDAAVAFPANRLPELFAGYPRRQHSFPVPYPDANVPQAWACGSVIYFLETLLGVIPMGERLLQEKPADGLLLSLAGVLYRGSRRML